MNNDTVLEALINGQINISSILEYKGNANAAGQTAALPRYPTHVSIKEISSGNKKVSKTRV
jgi:hypothetical protein